MAKQRDLDEEVKAPPKEKDSGKLLMIVAIALIAVSMALSAVSLLTVMNISKSLVKQEEALAEEEGPVSIPVTEINTFNFTDKFILQFKDVEDEKTTHNVVVEVSIGLLNTAKDYGDVELLLTEKEKIIRSGLEGQLTRLTYENFRTPDALEETTTLLTTYLQGIVNTETVIDVYFNNLLVSTKTD